MLHPLKLALLILLLLPAMLCAGEPWLRFASPNFELFTDAGPDAGGRMIRQFELIHGSLWRYAGGNPVRLPVRVLLFASGEEFEPYRLSPPARGYFLHSPARNYIALEYQGAQTTRVAYHEYVHLMLNHAGAVLPPWMEEGTAEFYSNMIVRDSSLYVGVPAWRHMQVLAAASTLRADLLAGPPGQIPAYSDRGASALFYAESWALVHMLSLAPGYREKLPRFAALLAAGVPEDKALQRSFGKPLEAVLADAAMYVRSGRLGVLQLDAPAAPPAAVSMRPVPPAEAGTVLADLRAQLGGPQVASAPPGRR